MGEGEWERESGCSARPRRASSNNLLGDGFRLWDFTFRPRLGREKGAAHLKPCRDTSLTRNRLPLGPYSRRVPRALWCSQGGGCFL